MRRRMARVTVSVIIVQYMYMYIYVVINLREFELSFLGALGNVILRFFIWNVLPRLCCKKNIHRTCRSCTNTFYMCIHVMLNTHTCYFRR